MLITLTIHKHKLIKLHYTACKHMFIVYTLHFTAWPLNHNIGAECRPFEDRCVRRRSG